ncbi:MAG: response regulator [Saprospiraceae bacterium]|nr:response regulator [Saprospiraceae bacterium]
MPYKILIVDDDPHILMPLEFIMLKSGYEVLIARNGTEALSIIADFIPHIVLLDIMMPDVDGYDICTYIKKQEKYDQTKVVFMSAKTSEEDIKKGYDLGASLYISKPFSTRILTKQIETLLAEA